MRSASEKLFILAKKKDLKQEALHTWINAQQTLVLAVPLNSGGCNLLFYAREHGSTEGNAVSFDGVRVQEFIGEQNKQGATR